MVARFRLSHRQSARRGQMWGNFQGIKPNAHARHILGKDRGPRCPGNAPPQHDDAQKVQHHVQDSRHGQKDQRHHGIADGAQEVCEIVIQKCCKDAQKDDDQILLHQGLQFRRDPQHPQNAPQPQIDQQVQRQCHPCNEHEGLEHAVPHFFLLAAAVLHRDGRAAAHAKAQQDGGQKGHQGVGGADRRQRIRAEEAADHPRVGDVVQLLQKGSEHQRQGEQQDVPRDGPFR